MLLEVVLCELGSIYHFTCRVKMFSHADYQIMQFMQNMQIMQITQIMQNMQIMQIL